MKTYFISAIPRIQQFSKKLDDLSLLKGQQWTLIDEETTDKTVYIFQDDGRLLISHNGKVTKASWEYLGEDSLLIDKGEESLMFRQGFFDEKIMALQLDNSNKYALLVNERKLDDAFVSIDSVANYLNTHYVYKNSSFQKKEQPRKYINSNKGAQRSTVNEEEGNFSIVYVLLAALSIFMIFLILSFMS